LGREHVLDLGRADTERERGERAVGRRVRIATDDGHAGQTPALLGTGDVHDALANVADVMMGDAVARAVLGQRLELHARDRIGDMVDVLGRHIVIRHRFRRRGPPERPLGEFEPLEGLRRGDFVRDVAIDIDQRRAIVEFADEMLIPDFVVERLAGHDASHGRSERAQF